MVAIITGIIIDTFSDLRGRKKDVETDESGVCFICSTTRDVFERKWIKFADHIEHEHNRWNYLYYKVNKQTAIRLDACSPPKDHELSKANVE